MIRLQLEFTQTLAICYRLQVLVCRVQGTQVSGARRRGCTWPFERGKRGKQCGLQIEHERAVCKLLYSNLTTLHVFWSNCCAAVADVLCV